MDSIEDFAAKRIEEEVLKKWFFSEPALHTIMCTHERVPNRDIPVPVRTGKGRVEYNPELIASESSQSLEQLMRAEMIRILLKHPYSRQPKVDAQSRLSASNVVLSDNYDFSKLNFDKADDFKLPKGQHFEWYARHIAQSNNYNSGGSDGKDGDASSSGSNGDGGKNNQQQNSQQQGGGGGCQSQGGDGQPQDNQSQTDQQQSNSQQNNQQRNSLPQGPTKSEMALSQVGLWEEDQLRQCEINEKIQGIRGWGSLPAGLQEKIIASTRAEVDYRKVLSGFRASTISSRRSLTRMRPNRRTDFQNMGSLYKLRTKLLVAVDTSGSVSNAELSNFFGVINKFFKHAIESVDVICFDAALHGEPVTFKKASKAVKIEGRGGTDFQVAFDYMDEHPDYDGLIMFTDGAAPVPTFKGRRFDVVWVLTSEDAYKHFSKGLLEAGRCCYIEF